MQIQQTPLLPYQVYYDACCLTFRQEIQVASGSWVHCYHINQVLYVSAELASVLQELAKEPAPRLQPL